MFSRGAFKKSGSFFFFIFLLFPFLIFSAGCLENDASIAVASKKYDTSVMTAINGLIDSQMSAGKIPGAIVGIWEDGYETQLIAKGMADVSAGRAALVTDRFRIASNTKMFTAMALLILADAKKIGLDDKVSKYINDLPHTDMVTIRQLANHTSGYYDYSSDPVFIASASADMLRKWSPRELMDFIKTKPLDFTPGSRYHYSNTNYVMMGLLIETVTGMSWESYITSKIISPLQMTETECPKSYAISGSYLKGYNVDDGLTGEIVVDPSWGWAAGGIISTVSDMKKWLDALAGHSLISSAMFAEHLKRVPDPDSGGTMEYGFGLMMIWSQFIGHTGVIPGYNSAAFISLDGKKAVVVVFNNEEGFYGADTAFKLTKMLFKK